MSLDVVATIATRRRILATMAIGLLPGACGGAPPPPPPLDPAAAAAAAVAAAAAAPAAIDLTVIGDGDVNGPAGAVGYPIRTEIFLLKSSTAFERLGFFQIVADGGPLAGDTALRRSLTVTPGSSQELRLEVPAGVTHIGVVGQYRAVETSAWRALRPVPRGAITKLTLRLRAAAVELEPASR